MWRLNKLSPAKWMMASTAFISTIIIIIIFAFLIKGSIPILRAEGWEFLFGREWIIDDVYGALPMIYGTVAVTLFALILTLPLSLGIAIFTSEFLAPGPRLIVKSIMELLAGIPGIIYGLLGVAILTTIVKETFGLIDGNTIFTASLLLGVMVLPTIMTLSEDALRAVPKEFREEALSLGLTRSETIWSAVMPLAMPGIISAVLLGLGRAIGETMAVMLVIGSLDRIPRPFYNIFTTAQTIPSKLGREASEALGYGLHWSALVALGLILLLMVMGTVLIADLFLSRRERWYGR